MLSHCSAKLSKKWWKFFQGQTALFVSRKLKGRAHLVDFSMWSPKHSDGLDRYKDHNVINMCLMTTEELYTKIQTGLEVSVMPPDINE